MENPNKRPRLALSSNSETGEKVESFLGQFVLSNDIIRRVMSDFEAQMKLAYSKDEATRKTSSVLNENTYIHYLLKGNESGDFLGLDLGGSNFRVIRVQLQNGQIKDTIKSYTLPEELMDKRAEKIFDHMAEQIASFLEEENVKDKKFPLGFTFSFPMKQSGIRAGSLVTWTKNFKCPNGPGDNVVTFLEDAIKRRKDLSVDVEALLCDTTATLIAGNGEDPDCRVGLIIGTGCNASFVEQTKHAQKVVQGDTNEVVIDVQWGGFGDNGCVDYIKTDIDRQVDRESNYPNSFAFEKMMAGLHLGEIVRLILVHFTKQKWIFKGKGSDKLFERMSFTAEDVSSVERDTDEDFTYTKKALSSLGLAGISEDDMKVVREVCSVISARGAHLVASNLAVLLLHMDKRKVTIAADGSVYEHHPHYHRLIIEKLQELVPQTKVKITLCKEGSGKGAALTAAIAVKHKITNP